MSGKSIFVAAALALAAATAERAAAQSCSPIATDAMRWITDRSRGAGSYWIAATVVTNQPPSSVATSPALHTLPAFSTDGTAVGYAEGRLNLVSAATPVGSPPPPPDQQRMLTGELLQMFSDRTELARGAAVIQPFNALRADRVTMTVQSSGEVALVLRSWGNATLTLTPTCTDGVMRATGPGVGAGAPPAWYLITLRKGFTAA